MFLAKFMKPLLRIFKRAGPKALSAAKKMSKTKLGKEVIKETTNTLKTGSAEVLGNLIKGEPEKAKQAAKKKIKNARNNIGNMVLNSVESDGTTPETGNVPSARPKKIGKKRKPVKGKRSKKKKPGLGLV